jgi:hypothetical protein
MMGACTIQDFTKTWTAKHQDVGFMSRLFIVGADDPTTRIPVPREPDPTALETLVEELKALFDEVRKCPVKYEWSPEAFEVWTRYYYENFGDSEEWNRIDTYAFRLMALQTLLEGDEQVSKATVQNVVELLNYEVAVRTILAPVIADNQAAEMEALIVRALAGVDWLSHRDLYRKANASRKGTKMFADALRNLELDKQITSRKEERRVLYALAHDLEESDIEGVISHVDDSLGKFNTLCINELAYRTV